MKNDLIAFFISFFLTFLEFSIKLDNSSWFFNKTFIIGGTLSINAFIDSPIGWNALLFFFIIDNESNMTFIATSIFLGSKNKPLNVIFSPYSPILPKTFNTYMYDSRTFICFAFLTSSSVSSSFLSARKNNTGSVNIVVRLSTVSFCICVERYAFNSANPFTIDFIASLDLFTPSFIFTISEFFTLFFAIALIILFMSEYCSDTISKILLEVGTFLLSSFVFAFDSAIYYQSILDYYNN